MTDIAMRVEHLSKRYRIGGPQARYQTLRDALVDAWPRISRVARRKNNSSNSWQENTIWALKDVSFEVKQGEVVGIIGRNGAGKTTLLKILSRITEPTEGRAEIHGRVGSLLEVGTGFHPELTGRENIYLNGAILGMRKHEIDKKFDEIVAFAEIEKFLDTPVKRYSSGMYVRLAFAVAAHLEPEILLVDEVLAVGDAAFQKKCLGKMGDVAKEGRTVLFVSHNMGAVNALCAKAMLFDGGRIILIGDSPAITSAYLARQISEGNACIERGYRVNLGVLNGQQIDGFEITKIELLNPKEPGSGARTGDPLVVRITYAASRQFLSPAFMVSFKDLYGQEIIRLSTMPISGYEIASLYRQGCVDLLIESLPLVAGRYYVDIGFAREQIEFMLRFESILEFEVQAQDVYGSGLLLDRSRGLFVVKHKWDHKDNGQTR